MLFKFPDVASLWLAGRRSRPVAEARRPVHLAVIGHARSGTTILLSALNTSPEVYLLGEPFAYRDAGDPNFRDRFNELHAGYGHQLCKSTYAPLLPNLPPDADLATYFDVLGEHHRIYGEKISLTTPRYGTDPEKLKHWVETNRPHCLFVFRRPQETLASMAKLFPNIRREESLYSYAMTVRLYFDLARTLPNVRHVIHEGISASTFRSLGRWLGADLGVAYNCYIRRREKPRSKSVSPELAPLQTAYDLLARKMRDGALLPELAQIGGSLKGRNGCELSRVYADLVQVMERTAPATLPA